MLLIYFVCIQIYAIFVLKCGLNYLILRLHNTFVLQKS